MNSASPRFMKTIGRSCAMLTLLLLAGSLRAQTVLNFTNQPQSVTSYAYQPVYFSASATNDADVPIAYQWRKNGADIPNATSSTCGFIASTNDNSAQIDCVAAAGSLLATSTIANVTIVAGVTITPNALLRDNWNTADWDLPAIESGASGPPDYIDTVSSLDLEGLGQYVVKRFRGFFIPPVTTNYVFFIVSDNHADLFLSTNSDQPDQAQMIAQNTGWVAVRDDWVLSGGFSGELIPGNVRSDYFSPDFGGTYPFSGGIWLTSGQRYYIEADYWDNDGGGWMGVTYKYFGADDPASGSPSIITSADLAYAAAPLTAVGFSSQPQGVADYAYQPVYFSASATNDGSVATTYQWRKDGVDVPGATSTTFGFITSTNENGAQVTCVATAGTLMATSSVATVTIVPGVVIKANELARDNWVGNDWSLPQIESGASGPPAYMDTVTSLDLTGLGQYVVKRMRGFFVPTVTTNYVFFIVSDNHADLFLSASDQPNQAQMIAQNTGWVLVQNDWGLGGPYSGVLNTANVRSDTFSPDGGATYPFSGGIWLTNGRRYYIEADYWDDDGGQWMGVNYKFVGAADPANGSPSVITSANLAYGALPLSVLDFTNQPQSVASFAYQAVYFTASATNDGAVTTAYQWRKNGVEVSGATGTSFGFITSTGDNGAQIDCVATAAALTATSSVATVTLNCGGKLVSGQLWRDNWSYYVTSIDDLETGASGPPDLASDTVTSLDLTDLGNYIAKRIWGFFTPPVTTNYVFFMVSDRDADLFLSTNSDQADQKQRIASCSGWVATVDDWTLSGAYGGGVVPANVRSDTFSPDGGVTQPFSGGIWLTNGVRYYIEVDYHKNDGGSFLGVNYKYVGDPDPVSGSPSVITSADLAYLSPEIAPPVLTITRSGSSVNVSWTPACGGTLESKTDLNSPTWTPVGTANPTNIMIGTGNLFLRVAP